MAIPVARVHLAMAHAALPALLPTHPKSKMLPLLPTPARILILPMSPPKPSRANAAYEKWVERKNATNSPSKPCRADAAERWDAHKASSSGSSSESSPGRASSCERWDSNKKSATSSSSSTSSSGSSSASRASSGEKWDSSNKRRRPGTGSRASSAGRWDAHKIKPRPPQADGIDDDDGQSSTGSNDMELDMPPQRAFYAGPGFLAAPEPSMLPMPWSLLMRRVAA